MTARLRTAGASLLLAALGVVGAASPAHALVAPACPWPAGQPPVYYNGCVTATGGLNARTHYGTGDVQWSDPPVTTYPFPYPYQTLVHVYCYLTGPWVQGPAGWTNIWDAVSDFELPDGTSFANDPSVFKVSSDAFIFTGSDQPIVRHC